MARIKTLKAKNLIDVSNGNLDEIIYPITSIKSVYTEDNVRLDEYLDDRIPDNLSTDGNGEIEKLTFEQLYEKIALEDEKNKVAGKSYIYMDEFGQWHHIYFIGSDDDAKTDKWENDDMWCEISGRFVLKADYVVYAGETFPAYTEEDCGKLVLAFITDNQMKKDRPSVGIVTNRNTLDGSYDAEMLDSPKDLRLNFGDEFIITYYDTNNKVRAYAFSIKKHNSTGSVISNTGVRINPDHMQSDWDEDDETSPAFIKNKPSLLSNPDTEAKIDNIIGGGNLFFDWCFENGRFGYGELSSTSGNLFIMNNSNSSYPSHSIVDMKGDGICMKILSQGYSYIEILTIPSSYFMQHDLNSYNKAKFAFEVMVKPLSSNGNIMSIQSDGTYIENPNTDEWYKIYSYEKDTSGNIRLDMNIQSSYECVNIYIRKIVMICGVTNARDITEYDFIPSNKYSTEIQSSNNIYTNYNCTQENILTESNIRGVVIRDPEFGEIDGYNGKIYSYKRTSGTTSYFRYKINIPESVNIGEWFQIGMYVKDNTYDNVNPSYPGNMSVVVKVSNNYSISLDPMNHNWQKYISPIIVKGNDYIYVEFNSQGGPFKEFEIAYICINKVTSPYHKFTFSPFTEESVKEIETQSEKDYSDTKISIIGNGDMMYGVFDEVRNSIPLGETKELFITRNFPFGRTMIDRSVTFYSYYKNGKIHDYYYKNGVDIVHGYTKTESDIEIKAASLDSDDYFNYVGTPDIMFVYLHSAYNTGVVDLIYRLTKKRYEQNNKTKFVIVIGFKVSNIYLKDILTDIMILGNDVIFMMNAHKYDENDEMTDSFMRKELAGRITDYLKSNKYYLLNEK